MKHDYTPIPVTPDRQERAFLPTFPIKSHLIIRNSRKQTPNGTWSKRNLVITDLESKTLYGKMKIKKALLLPESSRNISKSPVRGKSYSRSPHPSLGLSVSPPLIRPLHINKILKKTSKNQNEDPYKFILTGASYNYLKKRVLDKDSSTNSILDSDSLEVKYKNYSPEFRRNDSVRLRPIERFATNGYVRRKVVRMIGREMDKEMKLWRFA
ncbi:hypothetical protein SteCoe_16499 [Stentor coeruleus]|uniref:Uncharacterized protein n=1 Tax=Stentor coeruleus TaxID=5963 RepID=A0A1R2C134_9CILI|nr:hypothetical protein SteCoe_16499 [Stentor coeruleus]